MSLAVGTLSSFQKEMGSEGNKENGERVGVSTAAIEKNEGEGERNGSHEVEEEDEEGKLGIGNQTSENSLCSAAEDDDNEDDGDGVKGIDLGPQISLKTHLEKDKSAIEQEDESLRRWKEQLLGSVDLNSVGEHSEPEVKILSLLIQSPGRPDIVIPIPATATSSKGPWFTLKEGSHYTLKFTFSVSNNIVSGLRYTNTVWKTGIKVDSTKEMLGTFGPQTSPYTCEVSEDTTPSGMFARGCYSARTKFIDDDGKCYLDINYSFDIRKEWLAICN